MRALAAGWGGIPRDDVVVVPTSSQAWVATAGEVVAKLHAPWTDAPTLAARLRLAADRCLDGILVPPLSAEPVPLDPAPRPDTSSGSPGSRATPRWVSIWPRVDVVAHEPDRVPWAQAGACLARLHRVEVASVAGAGVPSDGAGVPSHGGVGRLRRGLAALAAAATPGDDAATPGDDAATPGDDAATSGDGDDAAGDDGDDRLGWAVQVVRDAAGGLPAAARHAWLPGRPRTLVHGDWHLGQLGLLPGSPHSGWGLIDVDDLGLGDPAWDLERPAAMWACGLLADEPWTTLVEAYRAAGGPALPLDADPWPVLDGVAQAGVVQAAAGAVRRAIEGGSALDEVDLVLVETCSRITARRRPA